MFSSFLSRLKKKCGKKPETKPEMAQEREGMTILKILWESGQRDVAREILMWYHKFSPEVWRLDMDTRYKLFLGGRPPTFWSNWTRVTTMTTCRLYRKKCWCSYAMNVSQYVLRSFGNLNTMFELFNGGLHVIKTSGTDPLKTNIVCRHGYLTFCNTVMMDTWPTDVPLQGYNCTRQGSKRGRSCGSRNS